MDPVDARAPLGFVHRAGRAENQDRRAVDVGVVDGHTRVQQADDVVQDGGHWLLRRFGETVSHPDGDFLVLAQQHFRQHVAAVVDQRVVQPAVRSARVQRRVRNLKLLEQVDNNVRPVATVRRSENHLQMVAVPDYVGFGFQLWKRCSMRDST